MLKIIIDVTPIDPKPSGVGLYVFNLVAALAKLQSSESFELGLAYQPGLKNWLKGKLDFPENLQSYPNLYQIPLPVRLSNIILDYFPDFFPRYLEPSLIKNNIFHGTNYNVYPFQTLAKIMTIYDLSFIKYPDYTDAVVQQYTTRIKKCLHWTDLIITISESSKQDIVNYLHFPEARIFVTPLASRYHAHYLDSIDIETEINKINYDFSKPYLLFVSTIEPRKNINTIIKAFNHLKKQHKIEHQLVLIGRKGWKFEPVFQAINDSPYNNEIHHLDYLSDQEVAIFYSKADVFVYPSFYEGFGLPILEAMTLGTPVITSNTSSLPEVAGNSAILINPDEPMELAEGIFNIISNSQLRQELIGQGKKQAQSFSWEETAKKTLKAYQFLNLIS